MQTLISRESDGMKWYDCVLALSPYFFACGKGGQISAIKKSILLWQTSLSSASQRDQRNGEIDEPSWTFCNHAVPGQNSRQLLSASQQYVCFNPSRCLLTREKVRCRPAAIFHVSLTGTPRTAKLTLPRVLVYQTYQAARGG
jgi:hypothetical protein